jgi:hypothetical protein
MEKLGRILNFDSGFAAAAAGMIVPKASNAMYALNTCRRKYVIRLSFRELTAGRVAEGTRCKR